MMEIEPVFIPNSFTSQPAVYINHEQILPQTA